MGELQDDIIKYKKGELSPQEMHALEKKALNDPFLADALEGIENISPKDLKNDVAEINQKISKERKIIFTPLRIAASVMLIMVSIFLIYRLVPKRETIALKTEKKTTPVQPPKEEIQKQVKKNEIITTPVTEKPKTERHKAVDAASKTIPKTTQPSNESIALAKPEKNAETQEAKKEAEAQAPVSIAMEPAMQDLKSDESESSKTKRALNYKAASGAGLARKNQIDAKSISGSVLSADDGSPLPGVNVVITGTTEGTVTDSNGKFTIQPDTEVSSLVFSFIGLQTQEVNVDGKDNINVRMKTDATQLSEVVVTGVSAAKDNDAEPVIRLAFPVGGIKAYDKYLESNLRYPEEALKNNIKGKVTVEFMVHVDGSFSQYTVTKSLGFGCDDEVIRLIKEGPKWSPSTADGRPVESKVRVRLKFDPSKAGR